MLWSGNLLRGYAIRTRDGDIGKVDDFLFDDQSWAVRYLVVDTGNWLTGRKVLVLPAALDVPDWKTEILTIKITTQQLENSPPLAADRPVSRQKEAELTRYYDWTAYLALGTTSFYSVPEQARLAEVIAETQEEVPKGDTNLRSMKEVTGYHIQAHDGAIGHVEDFIVDDKNWIIRYMVVGTRNWLPGRKVLVTPTWIEDVTWDVRKVSVNRKCETIQNSPEFDPSVLVNRE
jgi:uncharacterized protein YrrD